MTSPSKIITIITNHKAVRVATRESNRLTVMDLVSIFLIIAIAADDILLLYNTYHLAPAMLEDDGSQLSPAEKMRPGGPPGKRSLFITPITMGYRWIYHDISMVHRVYKRTKLSGVSHPLQGLCSIHSISFKVVVDGSLMMRLHTTNDSRVTMSQLFEVTMVKKNHTH